jgi:hypothetical protein
MFELWQVVVDDVREEIRTYQVYLIRERHLAPSSLEIAVCALRFLYKVTLRPALVVRRPDPRTEEAAAAPHRAQSRRRRRARRSGAPTQEKSPRFHPVIRKPSRPRGTRRPHGQDRVQSESGTTTGRLDSINVDLVFLKSERGVRYIRELPPPKNRKRANRR